MRSGKCLLRLGDVVSENLSRLLVVHEVAIGVNSEVHDVELLYKRAFDHQIVSN